MNQLSTLVKPELPTTMEDLTKFVLVGREKLTAVRACIRAIDKLDVAKEVREQKKEEAQMLADALLDAEAKIGEMLKELPKAPGARTDIKQPQFTDEPRLKKDIVKDLGFDANQVKRFETLAENKDIIEQVKAEAKENDDLPTRTEVLRRVKEKEQREKIEFRENQLKEQAKQIKSLKGIILEGDFFDVINKVENNSVDLLFVDPPYGVLDETWDNVNITEFTEVWLAHAMPKVKDTGRIYICFSQVYLFELYKVLEKNNFFGFKFGQLLIWQYLNNNKPSNRKLYRYSYEPIYYLYGNNADELNFTSDTYGETQNTVWTIATPQSNFNEGKFHPAQKPIELLERIIKTGSKENDIILDPFAGSGTTGVVCEKNNRHYILIEREKYYIEIARGRLNGLAC